MAFWHKIRLRLSASVARWPEPLQRLHLLMFQRWLGTRVHDHGSGNILTLKQGDTSGLRLSFFGRNNSVIVHKSARLSNVDIHMVSSGLKLEIHEGAQIVNGYFWLGGDDARVTIGARSYLINNSIILTDKEARLDIGAECMLGAGAQIRLGDGHALYDAKEGTILNKGDYVVLEPHVWLAQDVLVLKNVVIGAGSVIGARAVVTHNIPAGCVAAGIPAKVLRKGVGWRVEKIDQLPEDWYQPQPAGQ